MSVYQEVEGELALWRAALSSLLADATRYHFTRRDDTRLRAAYDDVVSLGPMLCRLCGYALADPELVRRAWLRQLSEHRRAA